MGLRHSLYFDNKSKNQLPFHFRLNVKFIIFIKFNVIDSKHKRVLKKSKSILYQSMERITSKRNKLPNNQRAATLIQLDFLLSTIAKEKITLIRIK